MMAHRSVLWRVFSGVAANGERSMPQQVGSELWTKYEDRKKRRDTISRYLQHCTTFRTEFKQWNPDEMMSELSATLELFERHLPDFKPASNSDVLNKP